MRKVEEIKNKNLIEEYLLGHLSGQQLEEFEIHLKSCENCSSDLEAERQMIFGISSYARRSMKNEIRLQVEELRKVNIGRDWTLISKIAAVLFLID